MQYIILPFMLLIGSISQAMENDKLEQSFNAKDITIFANKAGKKLYCRIRDKKGNNVIQYILDDGVKKFPKDSNPYYVQLDPEKSLKISWPANAEELHLTIWQYQNLISSDKSDYHILKFGWLKHQQDKYELKPHTFRFDKDSDIYTIIALFAGKQCVAQQDKLQFRQDSAPEEITIPGNVRDTKIVEEGDKLYIQPNSPWLKRRAQRALEQIDKVDKMTEKFLSQRKLSK